LNEPEFKLADSYLRNNNFGIQNYLITMISKSQPSNSNANFILYNVEYQKDPGVRP